MARKSTSTASGAAKAPECCAKCEKDIAELRKEIAALKSAGGSPGGVDPRVDKLISALIRIFPTEKENLSF